MSKKDEMIVVTLTREQARALADAADQGLGAWSAHPKESKDSEPARSALDLLIEALRRGL